MEGLITAFNWISHYKKAMVSTKKHIAHCWQANDNVFLRFLVKLRFSISARSEGVQDVEDVRKKLKNSRGRSHSTVTGCFLIFLAQIQRLVRPQ